MTKHNPILYPAHEAQRSGIKTYFNALAAGLNFQTAVVSMAEMYGFAPKPYAELTKNFLTAAEEMTERFAKEYTKPAFGLDTTETGGKTVRVTEETIKDKDFGKLVHFKRETDRNDPKVLLVAPMSGHHATLLRDTVAALLPDHDVYITDWKDARDVSMEKGDFGLDDYIDYVKEFIKAVGPETHVMAVCQPTVPVLAAVSRLAEEKSDCQPLSMTLMGGPLDTRAASTEVTKLAESKDIDWFEENLIGKVPEKYEGRGRLVYPGFVQLFSFMSMNPEKHAQSHIDMFNSLMKGNREKAEKIKDFYDEYLAVCDLPAKFYLETVKKVFIDHELPRGLLTHHGDKVDPAAIRQTALFTVEGEKDDISAPGQTLAVRGMCKNIAAGSRFHYLQPDAGHYGIFNGHHWREEIAPRITGFIRETGKRRGLAYTAPNNAIAPEAYAPPAAPDKKPRRRKPAA
ncbi:MAG: polyhydroxyalkanoate depolymerase [Alphaproteobacteria bacterium]|nr:polyhydroxyalkanoate depolymerase [Alphaproteobacteria bacterium]